MFFTGFKVAVKLKFIVSRNGRSTTRNGDFIGKDWNAKITGYFYIKLQARQEQRMCLLLVGLIFSTTEPLVLNPLPPNLSTLSLPHPVPQPVQSLFACLP